MVFESLSPEGALEPEPANEPHVHHGCSKCVCLPVESFLKGSFVMFATWWGRFDSGLNRWLTEQDYSLGGNMWPFELDFSYLFFLYGVELRHMLASLKEKHAVQGRSLQALLISRKVEFIWDFLCIYSFFFWVVWQSTAQKIFKNKSMLVRFECIIAFLYSKQGQKYAYSTRNNWQYSANGRQTTQSLLPSISFGYKFA